MKIGVAGNINCAWLHNINIWNCCSDWKLGSGVWLYYGIYRLIDCYNSNTGPSLEIDLMITGNACHQINLILLTTFTVFKSFDEQLEWWPIHNSFE